MRAAAPVLWRGQRWWWNLTRAVTLGVKVILIEDGLVLLVKQTYRRGWFLPGGGVKRGESFEEAARREAMEEVGAAIEGLALVGVYSQARRRVTDHIVVFAATRFTVSPNPNWEVERTEFFAVDALPADTARSDQRRIEEWLRGDGAGSGRW